MAVTGTDINYTFSDSELEKLKHFGDIQRHNKGEVLIPEGSNQVDCLITLTGQVDIHIATTEGSVRVGWMEPGQFAGDITVLTGHTSLAETTMGETGDVLHITHESFKRLLAENVDFSDIFVRTLTARRAFARQSDFGTIIVIGAAQDRTVFAARDLLAKHGVPHTWLDPESDELASKVLATRDIPREQIPVVLRGNSRVLSKPTVSELSEAFGLDLLPDGSSADVVIVGAGPAGLAASVYAASEGLSVVTIDADGPGGQAGTSSKIENYLGFPQGLSGRELSERASVQAQKFGVRIATPARAKSVYKLPNDYYCLELEDGRKLSSKAIVVATGAQYRRLPLNNLEKFEGRGIYYGATPMEAQLCGGAEVAVIGAGNSAGQGAMYLSKTAKQVHVVFRRDNIRETMSEYLVKRLEESPNVTLHPSSAIAELHGLEDAAPGEDRLASVTFENSATGQLLRCPVAFVFLFVGAAPFTQWLPEQVRCDDKGFIKTGADLESIDLVRAGWQLERLPSRYETSMPRVYAVGDVRTGSVKRVASAVGEGSVVVSDIHRALAEVN